MYKFEWNYIQRKICTKLFADLKVNVDLPDNVLEDALISNTLKKATITEKPLVDAFVAGVGITNILMDNHMGPDKAKNLLLRAFSRGCVETEKVGPYRFNADIDKVSMDIGSSAKYKIEKSYIQKYSDHYKKNENPASYFVTILNLIESYYLGDLPSVVWGACQHEDEYFKNWCEIYILKYNLTLENLIIFQNQYTNYTTFGQILSKDIKLPEYIAM